MKRNIGMIQLEETEEAWKGLLREELADAGHFEIHCWEAETEQIRAALEFGTEKDSSWEYGTVIAGAVTPEFRAFLLELPCPAEEGKRTPFYSLFLDNGFFSEHYGAELYHL